MIIRKERSQEVYGGGDISSNHSNCCQAHMSINTCADRKVFLLAQVLLLAIKISQILSVAGSL